MPLLLDTLRPGPAVDLRGRNCLTIGLVNNMPDAACEATERQFLRLLRAASNDVVVLLKLFSIAAVPRSEATRAELAGRYRDISELWNAPLDGLIVTGTEPIASDLKDEPYWNALCDLVDWACHDTISAVWSCLARTPPCCMPTASCVSGSPASCPACSTAKRPVLILCSPVWRRVCACRIRGSTTCRKRACSKTAIAC
jgi:hypothetical protein